MAAARAEDRSATRTFLEEADHAAQRLGRGRGGGQLVGLLALAALVRLGRDERIGQQQRQSTGRQPGGS